MTSSEAAIERVRAYVEARETPLNWFIDVAIGGDGVKAELTLGDLRALLALDAPVERGVTEALRLLNEARVDGFFMGPTAGPKVDRAMVILAALQRGEGE